ncbi:hypothetical protein MY4824_004081 [Beauveria thailandica]
MAGYDAFDPRMSPETPLRSQTTPYLSILSTLRHEISSSLGPGQEFRVGLLEGCFSLAGVSDEANNPAVANILLSELCARKRATLGLEAEAHRKVFELRAAYDAAFADVDVLITPCAPTVAMPHPE